MKDNKWQQLFDTGMVGAKRNEEKSPQCFHVIIIIGTLFVLAVSMHQ